MDEPEVIEICAQALAEGRDVRLHLHDGEVVEARLIWVEEPGLCYAALRSSHPERYAVCDSTGVELTFGSIARASVIAPRRRVGR